MRVEKAAIEARHPHALALVQQRQRRLQRAWHLALVRTRSNDSFSRLEVCTAIAVLITLGGAFGVFAQGQPAPAQPGGDLPGDPSLRLVQVATGFIDPINVASAHDGSGCLFVVERVGTIRIVQDGQVIAEPFLDISDEVKIDNLEQGLISVAFHPDYETNGLFYVYHIDYYTNGDHFLVEYAVSANDPNLADPESGRVLLTLDDPHVYHNGGTMRFGRDGYLYIATGDGGYAGDPYDNAQALDTLLGKLLRIDVTASGSAPYTIPETNPFAPGGVQQSSVAIVPAQTGDYRPEARPEIYAYGLRNPWQFSFDPETGELYISDPGQVGWEEINYQTANAGGGQNYGWDLMEASHCYPPNEDDACGKVGVMPVAEYGHGDGDCSIIGIGVYRGEPSPELDGIYFASDYCSGRFWGLARDDAGIWQFQELLDTDLVVVAAGQGEDGELYVTTCTCQLGRDYDPFANPTGTVWQLVSAGQVPEGAATPAGISTPAATPAAIRNA